MFPNGYNMPFYSSYAMPRMSMGMGAMPRSSGLFSRLGLSGIRGINWQNLLNSASRTLGVINQAIPIVKQVGPMYNNMKSMLKIVSLFKDETDPVPNRNNKATNNNVSNNSKEKEKESDKENTIINNNYSNRPNFFI